MKLLVGRLRSGMTVAGILSAVAALSGAALTNAAWLDDEYVHARGVGTDGKCELNSGTISTASARQFSGTLLGYDLDNLASVQGVQVSNDGAGTSTANPGAIRIDDNTFMAPLDLDLLNNDFLQFSLPLGLPIGAADVHSQWSQTLNNGNTTAASGLVTNSGGAISLGQPQDPVNPPVMAALDLGALAPTALSGMTLEVGSASSIARATQCGDIGNSWLGPLEEPLLDRAYSISSLDLQATLPTLSTAVSGTTELLDGVQASLDAASEAMQVSISEDLALAAVPLLGDLTLGSVDTQVTMSRIDLTPLRALLHGTMTDDRGLLTVDFDAGTLRVDLAKTAGGVNGLNGLDPNTEIILNQAMMDELTAAFTQVLNDWQENIASALIDAIRATTVTADSVVHVLSEGVPVAEIRLGLGPTSVGQLLNLHNDVPGTPAVPVTTSVRLLDLDPLGLLSPTLQDLESGLAAALPGIVGEALNEELVLGIMEDVKTSVATLTGPVGASVSSALDELSRLLSIMVNVQPDKPGHPEPSSAGPFRISALHLSLFELDVLDLSVATSTVGYGI